MALEVGIARVLKQLVQGLWVLGQAWRIAIVAAQRLGILGADPKQVAFTFAQGLGRPQGDSRAQRDAGHSNQQQHTQVSEARLGGATTRHISCHHAPSRLNRS
ncbi:hypothetical protein D3C76_1560660 [compost metagenome]